QVTGSGHSLAMSAAAQNASPSALLAFNTSGLAGIQGLKELDAALKDAQELDQLMQSLKKLHQKLLSGARKLLVVGEAGDLDDFRASLGSMQVDRQAKQALLPLPAPGDFAANQLWVANSQVNFCAKAYKTVPTTHADAPALTVLGGFMRNTFLHTSLREQGGAYGGGATQDNFSGSFRFFSYRD
ncbi:MAG: peptidase M16, partial [Pseudomonadales bacterium]